MKIDKEMGQHHADAVCTTQEAAHILGISVTSVQQLVEAGVMDAWKTKGGHRRIPLAAVQAYKSVSSGTSDVKAARTEGARSSVLVVEDNVMQRGIYERQFDSWGLPVDVFFCETGYQALIEIASRRPDILLADIVMPGIDGYEVISTVLGYPSLTEINIAILSSLSPEELGARGGVPAGVVFFRKPINYDELRGYVRACCAQKARASRFRAE